MSTPLTRRRFIAIAATLAVGAGIPFAISRKPIGRLIQPARIKKGSLLSGKGLH